MADAKIVITGEDRTRAAFESAKKNLEGLGVSAGGFASRFATIGGAVGAIAVTAGAAAIALVRMADNIAKYQDLADAMGDTAENVASLQTAADVSGTSLDTVASASVRLTAALAKQDDESKGAAAALKGLGINVEEFKRLAAADQIEAVATAMAGFQDGTEKSAYAVALFGKAGAELMPFLKDLVETGGRQTRLTAEQIEQADRLSKEYAKLQSSANLLGQTIAANLIPPINAMIDRFRQGQKEGESLFAFLMKYTTLPGLAGVAFDKVFGTNLTTAGRTLGDLRQELDQIDRALQNQNLRSTQRNALLERQAQLQQQIRNKAESAVSRPTDVALGKLDTSPLATGKNDAAAKAAARELEAQNKLLLELGGLAGDFAEDWDRLSKLYAAGRLNLEGLVKAQATLLAKQPAVRAEAEAQAKAEKEATEAREARAKDLASYIDGLVQQATRTREGNQALREEIEEIGLTVEQLIALRAARMNQAVALKEQELAGLKANNATESEIYLLEQQIALLRERRDLEGAKARAEVKDQQRKEGEDRTKAIGDSIEEGILNGFRDGTSIADIFLRELKGQFARTVLRPQIDFVAKGLNQLLEQILGTGKGGGISGLPGGLGGLLGGGGGVLQAAFSQTALGSSGFGTGLAYGNLDLGGFYADGGRPPLGRVSVVGERGPELFVPDSAGTIVPNHKLGARGGDNFYITVGDVATKQMVMDAVRQGQRQSAAQFSRSSNYGGDL